MVRAPPLRCDLLSGCPLRHRLLGRRVTPLKHITLNYCFNGYCCDVLHMFPQGTGRDRSVGHPPILGDPPVQNYERAWLRAGMAALAMSVTQSGFSSVRRRGVPLSVPDLAPEGQFSNGRFGPRFSGSVMDTSAPGPTGAATNLRFRRSPSVLVTTRKLDAVRLATATGCPVGAGHSFTALVPGPDMSRAGLRPQQ